MNGEVWIVQYRIKGAGEEWKPNASLVYTRKEMVDEEVAARSAVYIDTDYRAWPYRPVEENAQLAHEGR